MWARVSLSSLCGLCLLLALVGMAVTTPARHNWDMVAYLAVAQTMLGTTDAEQVHQRVWQQVTDAVPEPTLRRLQGRALSNFRGPRQRDTLAYRQVVAQDPLAFSQQLPFYSVKPLYPSLIALATHAGIAPVAASSAISKVAWLLLGCVVYALLLMRFRPVVALAIALALMAMPMTRALASYGTPDALATLLLLWAVLLLMRSSVNGFATYTVMAALMLLELAVLARPDSLLLLLLVVLWLVLQQPQRWLTGSVIAVGAITIWWVQCRLAGNYGWAVLFYHSFIDYLEYPAAVRPNFSLAELVPIYYKQIELTRQFFWFVAVGLVAIVVRQLRNGRSDKQVWALIVLLAFMLAHWLLFPDQKDRMMLAPYLFILISSVSIAADTVPLPRWLGGRPANELSELPVTP